MKHLVLAATLVAASGLGTTTADATPLNCSYEYEYAPGPAHLDPDGDGRWFEEGSYIEQRGAIIGVKQTCSGYENEEAPP